MNLKFIHFALKHWENESSPQSSDRGSTSPGSVPQGVHGPKRVGNRHAHFCTRSRVRKVRKKYGKYGRPQEAPPDPWNVLTIPATQKLLLPLSG